MLVVAAGGVAMAGEKARIAFDRAGKRDMDQPHRAIAIFDRPQSRSTMPRCRAGHARANQIQCSDPEFSTCLARHARIRRDIAVPRCVLIRDLQVICPLSAQRSR
jgi:hypothetical protein